jgi:DNA-binding MarR family transcriptional regulator
MGFVETVPELKRGTPFRLTEAGKKRLEELKQEALAHSQQAFEDVAAKGPPL